MTILARLVRVWRSTFFVVIATLCFASPSASAATLNVDGSGILLGASGIDIGGDIYNVQFVDGHCNDFWDGCDDATDFDFSTSLAALMAAQALMEQVFVGTFDDDPAMTSGCGDYLFCMTVIPYDVYSGFAYAGAQNWQSAYEIHDAFFLDKDCSSSSGICPGGDSRSGSWPGA